MDKIKHLIDSYTPVLSQSEESQDPGSVLTTLCGDMIKESQERYKRVIPKHKVQFLNLFDAVKREPVFASKGYIQFQTVTGYEGSIPVAKGTQVVSTVNANQEMTYETQHDISAVTGKPQILVVTDGKEDRLITKPYDMEEPVSFQVFDIAGENEAIHQICLCFENLFSCLTGLDQIGRAHV